MGKHYIIRQLEEWACLTPSTLCFLFMGGSVFLTYKIASWINFSEIRKGTSAFFPEADDIWMPGLSVSWLPLCHLPSPLIHLHHWKPPVTSLSSSGSQSLRAGLSTVLSPIHLGELTGVLPWCDGLEHSINEKMWVMTLVKNSLISQSNKYYTTQGWHYGALILKLTFWSPHQLLFPPWDWRDWTHSG